MKQKTIIHIFGRSVFLRYYLEYLKNNFADYQHVFLIYGRDAHSGLVNYPEYEGLFTFIDIGMTPTSRWLNPFCVFSKRLRKLLRSADMVIAHALHAQTIDLLTLHKYLLSKTFWMVWGEEFNTYYKANPENGILYELLRRIYSTERYYRMRFVAREIQYVNVQNTEYIKLKKYYNPHAKRVELLSNYPRDHEFAHWDKDDITRILVGHSGWRKYGHIEALDILEKYQNENIMLYLPMSYGDKEYIDMVDEYAHLKYGDKVCIMRDFLDPDKYQEFLQTIDVGIFNEPVQTGLGNIFALLGYGKKVYLNDFGQNIIIVPEKGLIAHKISSIQKESFTEFKYQSNDVSEHNINITEERRNPEKIFEEWKIIFDMFSNPNIDDELLSHGMLITDCSAEISNQ